MSPYELCAASRSADAGNGKRHTVRRIPYRLRQLALSASGSESAKMAGVDTRQQFARGGVCDCRRPARSGTAAAGRRHSLAAHQRRVQLFADGRHLLPLPAYQSNPARVAAFRDLPCEYDAHLSLEIPGVAGTGAGSRRDRISSTLDRRVSEHSAAVWRDLLGAASLCASGLGAAGRVAGGGPYRAFVLLDEFLLGRLPSSRRGGTAIRSATDRAEPPAARISVCGLPAAPGYFPAVRRLRLLAPSAGVLRLQGDASQGPPGREASFNGAACGGYRHGWHGSDGILQSANHRQSALAASHLERADLFPASVVPLATGKTRSDIPGPGVCKVL